MNDDATIRARVVHHEPLSQAGLVATLHDRPDFEMCENVLARTGQE